MKTFHGMTRAVAVCATLLVAGTADAGMGKKSGKAAATAPAACTAPAPVGPGAMGMMNGAGPGRGPGFGAVLLDRFDEIDTDKNGQLSRGELEAWKTARQQDMQQRVAEHIKAADTNGDGQISLDEAKAGLPMVYDHFDFLDANHDGQVSQAEFERLRDPVAMRAEVLARLKAADKDGDGKLNLAEVQVAFPAIAARFSQLDRNNDGYITLPELPGLMGPH
jgi:Ca2+-binding EF-hand superfamily protein